MRQAETRGKEDTIHSVFFFSCCLVFAILNQKYSSFPIYLVDSQYIKWLKTNEWKGIITEIGYEQVKPSLNFLFYTTRWG